MKHHHDHEHKQHEHQQVDHEKLRNPQIKRRLSEIIHHQKPMISSTIFSTYSIDHKDQKNGQ